MVAAPHAPNDYANQNARAYLQSLQDGQRPDIRPEFGRWEPIVTLAENVFADTKKPEDKGPQTTRTLGSMIRTKKYPGLAELLAHKAETAQKEAEDALSMPVLPDIAQLPPALSLHGCQWLDQYVEYSKAASPEGYEDFHEACGLWALSTIAARRIKIPLGGGEYTPLNIVLVARTSLYAKSSTADVAVKVLKYAGLKWLLGADETTPQKLLTDMAGAIVPKHYTKLDSDRQETIKKRLAMAAQRGWYYDEFGEFVKAMNKANGSMADFKKLLLRLDACADSYTYSTQSRGCEEIDKPYLALLGCTTPAGMRSTMKRGSSELEDGTHARFAFICPPPDTALDKPFGREVSVPPALYQLLWQWHERLGVPVIDIEEEQDDKGRVTDYTILKNELSELPETVIDYAPIEDAWIRYRSALKALAQKLPTEDFDGSYQRLPVKALRIAALFASLEGSPSIEMRHWAKAQEIAERWRKSLHELYAQVNTADIATSLASTVEEKILAYVEKNQHETDLQKKPTLRNLARYVKGASSGMLKSAVLDLTRVHLLKEMKAGKAVYYQMGTDTDDG